MEMKREAGRVQLAIKVNDGRREGCFILEDGRRRGRERQSENFEAKRVCR